VPITVSNSLLITGNETQLEGILEIVEQLDQPLLQVRMHVVLLKLMGKEENDSGGEHVTELPKGDMEQILSELKKVGEVKVIARSQLRLLDNEPGLLQLGGRIPHVTSTTTSSRGRTNSVSIENVGTVIQATCRVSDSEKIAIQFELESSLVGDRDEGVVVAESQNAGPIVSPVIETVSVQTTIIATSGVPVILGGIAYRSEEQRGDMLLILQPEIVK
jgi:type II secretory pathway component GspD/PulD (secretin)